MRKHREVVTFISVAGETLEFFEAVDVVLVH